MDEQRSLLVEKLRDGDHHAADQLVDIYYEQLYRFFRRLGHSRQESEDLIQESFLRAWQHIGQLRNHRALNSWLYRIAANVSRLNWRKRKGKEHSSIDGIQMADIEGLDAGTSEQLNRLTGAIASLPVKLRQAVVLHYMQYLTIYEAAEAAEVTVGTFKSRLSRALKALKKQIS